MTGRVKRRKRIEEFDIQRENQTREQPAQGTKIPSVIPHLCR